MSVPLDSQSERVEKLAEFLHRRDGEHLVRCPWEHESEGMKAVYRGEAEGLLDELDGDR